MTQRGTMTQKALLVAVGNPGFVSPLDSPKDDILLWRSVLERYGFPQENIRQRIEKEAKRSVVLEDIRWLVSDVGQDDQIVFVFLGHGRLVEAYEGASEDYEEALIVYPDDPNDERSAEITDSKVTQIVIHSALDPGVDAVVGIDACFAGYFDIPVPPFAKPLFIPPANVRDLVLENVRAFGSLGLDSEQRRGIAPLRADGVGRPVVVAACGRTEGAYELPIDGAPHMIFTLRATDYLGDALDQRAEVTFNMLVADIYPLQDGLPQRPEIRGNKDRAVERFPGQPGSPLSSATLKPSIGATTIDGPTMLNIRFEGIVCFADARRESDPYRKRVLFPHDDRMDPNVRHLTFIEIPDDHLYSVSGTLKPKPVPHENDPTNYSRWELRGHVIRVVNTDKSKPLRTTALFNNHVPKMTKVDPDFASTQYHPREECFRDDPGAALLDAYFDLVSGKLSTGPLDRLPTVFQRDSPPPTLTIVTSPVTPFELPLTSEIAKIEIVPFGGGSPVATIEVKKGGKVRIGNAREGDIVGSGTPEKPREHFKLYYELANPKPANPSLPLNTGVPEMFCPPSGWP